MFKFNIFKRVKKPDPIKQRKDVFISIYENLQDAWMGTGELTSCSLKIDVSKFDEPVSEWVRAINRNLYYRKWQCSYSKMVTNRKNIW